MDNNGTTTEEKTDPMDDLLRGAKAIGEFIKKKPGATNYALVKGWVPAFKEGAMWISSKSRIRQHYKSK